jgi:hypothetical protein
MTPRHIPPTEGPPATHRIGLSFAEPAKAMMVEGRATYAAYLLDADDNNIEAGVREGRPFATGRRCRAPGTA